MEEVSPKKLPTPQIKPQKRSEKRSNFEPTKKNVRNLD